MLTYRPKGTWRGNGLLILLLALSLTAGQAEEAPPGTVVFGGDEDYPPFEWLERGEPRGFNVELEDAIATVGGARAEHRLGDWPDIVRALEAGEIDVVPMFRSEHREQQFLFTSSIFYLHHSIYAREGEGGPYTLPALAGKTVIVEELSYAHQQIEELGLPVKLYLESGTLEALRALDAGKGDVAILAVAPANELIRRDNFRIKRSGVHFWPREYSFAVRKDRPELFEWLRDSLTIAVTSGVYEDIHDRWESRLQGQHEGLASSLRSAWIVVVPLFLLVGIAAGWLWTLRRTVNSRTADLRRELERRERAESALKFAADHDLHTGLPELHYFVEMVDEQLETAHADSGQLLEAAMLKLAELDNIRQTFGGDVANLLIRQFAERMRQADCGVGGYLGRGVFVVFAEQERTRQCVKLLSEKLRVDELELHPSIICGSACWPHDGDNASALVRHAEIALATSVSRNHEWTAYDESMEPDKNDIRVITAFRETQGEQVRPAFQPQVDLRTNEVVGAEALARWTHPELGFISPARFIPLLESTGLVTRLTERMVGEAARVATLLQSPQRALSISVNISAYDLVTGRFIDVVERALKSCDCAPQRLTLELTETSVAEDPDRVRRALLQLTELGVKIAVDDFGTGYSSLSYLSSFPIHEVKIDRDFVDGVATSTRKQSIVRSTILMAREMGMITVAEGAEDRHTLDFLSDAGCDRVQGYVIARPMPEDELQQFVNARNHPA